MAFAHMLSSLPSCSVFATTSHGNSPCTHTRHVARWRWPCESCSLFEIHAIRVQKSR
jgi:hypothetical protein